MNSLSDFKKFFENKSNFVIFTSLVMFSSKNQKNDQIYHFVSSRNITIMNNKLKKLNHAIVSGYVVVYPSNFNIVHLATKDMSLEFTVVLMFSTYPLVL